MSVLKVNIKKLGDLAVTPTYSRHGDAGMDLTATSKWYDKSGNVCYGTSLAFEIPHGYVGLLFPRSSNTKKDLILGNSVGVIDSGYRGEVVFKFKSTIFNEETMRYEYGYSEYAEGDRIGQIIIMPYPQIEFNLVDELSTTDRGIGGFGSTDPVNAAIESNYDLEEDKELNAIADRRKGQNRISVDIEDL
jgi:dUTP pyrophosphatase